MLQMRPWQIEEDSTPFNIVVRAHIRSEAGEHTLQRWEFINDRYFSRDSLLDEDEGKKRSRFAFMRGNRLKWLMN